MKRLGILAILAFLIIGCGGGSSSSSTPETNSTESEAQEVVSNKLLNESVIGRWHVYTYDKNNKVSQQLYYYDFHDDGEVIFGSPYQDKEYTVPHCQDH